MEEMVNEGASYFEVSPATKKIIVKNKYHEKIIETKQLALVNDEWRIIVQKNKNNAWKIDLFDIADKNSSRSVSDQFPMILNQLVPQLEDHFDIDIINKNFELSSGAREDSSLVN